MVRMLALILGMFVVTPLVAAELSGTVTDSDGKPLANVRVDISTAVLKTVRSIYCQTGFGDCKKWAKTDELGRFVLTDLDPDLSFRLLATAPGKTTTHTAQIDPATERVQIRLDDEPTVDDNHLFMGQVVDARGAPVPGAMVLPYGAKTKEMYWQNRIDGAKAAVTDDNGRFRITATDDFVFLEMKIINDGTPGMMSSALKPGKRDQVIKIPTGTSVHGNLVTKDEAVAANQKIGIVQMNSAHNKNFVRPLFTTTDSGGNFEFHHLPPNQPYFLYTPRRIASSELCLKTTVFQAGEEGAAVEVGSLKLERGHRLSGKVIWPDGEPIPSDLNVTVWRLHVFDMLEIPVAPDGTFVAESVAHDSCSIGVTTKEWLIDETKSNFHFISARSFAWGFDEDVTNLQIPLRRLTEEETARHKVGYKTIRIPPPGPGTQTISGVVVDRAGTPIAGASLHLEEPHFFYVGPYARTETDGKFQFPGLPDVPLIVSYSDKEIKSYFDDQHRLQYYQIGQVNAGLNQRDVRIVLERQIPFAEIEHLPVKQVR